MWLQHRWYEEAAVTRSMGCRMIDTRQGTTMEFLEFLEFEVWRSRRSWRS